MVDSVTGSHSLWKVFFPAKCPDVNQHLNRPVVPLTTVTTCNKKVRPTSHPVLQLGTSIPKNAAGNV